MNAVAGRRRERGGRIAVAVAVVLAVAAAARSRLGSTPGASSASSASVASPPPAIAYPAGPGALYDVTWDVVTRLPPTLGGAVAATGSQVSLTGRVQVADLGAQGARRLVGVRVRELEAARLEAFGRPLHPTLEAARADLVDQPVVLALSPAGRVDDLYLAPTTSPLAANVLRGLALHFAASLESASATSDGGLPAPTTEPGDFGAVSWRDAWKGTTSELSRVHVGEGSKGTASIVFEGATPRRIQATLEIDESREGRRAGQGRASFSASRAPERAAGDAFPSVDLGTFARHDPTAPVGVADTRAENAALANGMTRADMLAIVAAYNVGKTPERGSIIRVAAFLRTEPSACDALADAFPRLADDGRELVLDMLASSGDAKAQAVMRALLATTTTADPAARERQVQRFSLVVEPTDESVRFVSDAWQRARMEGPPGVAFAWAHTAGSIVSHARESGRPELGGPLLAALLRELRGARDASEERALLGALGNAGAEEAREEIVRRTRAGDRRLRAQAAVALRKLRTPDVRRVLFELVGDADVSVAQAALRSLDTQPIGEEDMRGLADRVAARATSTDLDPALVSFVKAHPVDRPASARILDVIEARVGDRAELRAQLGAARAALAP